MSITREELTVTLLLKDSVTTMRYNGTIKSGSLPEANVYKMKQYSDLPVGLVQGDLDKVVNDVVADFDTENSIAGDLSRKYISITIFKDGETLKLKSDGSVQVTALPEANVVRRKTYETLPGTLQSTDLSKIYDIISTDFNTDHGVGA